MKNFIFHFFRLAAILKFFCLAVLLLTLITIVETKPAFAQSQKEHLKVHFIDVGYGDAILIAFPDGSTMLLDAGEENYSEALVDYLKHIGVKYIDTAVITHPHENHFEGFNAVLDHWLIGQVFINGESKGEEGYTELLDYFKEMQIPLEQLKAGSIIQSSSKDIKIQVLHPANLTWGANGNSLVLWLQYGQTYFLFTGDIGIRQQDDLIKNYPFIRTADCVQIPHHGRDLSKSFINTFKDIYFVASTGPNKWGMPNLDDLKELNGPVLRTDALGTIVLESDGRSVQVIYPGD